ncbi:thioesterase superfamily [Reichenbachiella sp. 5M10]|uniref:PaaI family thioesterase n=1 Tax=Reichenbachiella sp. 5M10 TaxID=1889772 RepID=UPI000C15A6C8|nr:PaaI family thioesterase [Reichenbachiella sp. 5M10]PIB36048.1 thioesterase superfamily [Reichenbachiella sp. 5M10]
MSEQIRKKYFQDFMPENVCFGCGTSNADGLHVKSYWEGSESVCHWDSQTKYHGWANLMNGGVMATLIDCHCMCTAMAYAYQEESRELGSSPEYRYATGTLSVKYLKPTSNNDTVELRARVLEVKGKKTVLKCDFYCLGEKTAEADVVAIRVFDSSQSAKGNLFKS